MLENNLSKKVAMHQKNDFDNAFKDSLFISWNKHVQILIRKYATEM
jgi:hypothetical protein